MAGKKAANQSKISILVPEQKKKIRIRAHQPKLALCLEIYIVCVARDELIAAPRISSIRLFTR